ncbi:hypothetical protein VTK73DRAFT_6395 [Phialemonium thermophilum]|uniref:Uncharacterized protein n=1 Tax=Phialemonium thermophilum TaxID=223376 RepID=A0ABR3XWF9_9PEZI
MAFTGEILDSDDDGEPVDPVDPVHSPLHLETRATEFTADLGDAVTTVDSGATGSTSQSFFQSIYEEQRIVATDKESVAGVERSSDVVEDKDAELRTHVVRQQNAVRNSSSLTSITDPPRKRVKKSHNRASVVDLTQVTTPGRARSSDRPEDLWDVPSSPLPQLFEANRPALPKASEQGERRKLTELDCLAFPATHEGEEVVPWQSRPSPGRRKSRRSDLAKTMRLPRRVASSNERGDDAAYHDDVNQEISLIQIPDTEKIPPLSQIPHDSSKHRTFSGKETGIGSTTSSLYIVQSALTASQRQTYQYINPSSEAESENSASRLPVSDGKKIESVHDSSGTTTIAYTTPSRYASSGLCPQARNIGTASSVDARRRSQRADGWCPTSSPDIVAGPYHHLTRDCTQQESPTSRRTVSDTGPADQLSESLGDISGKADESGGTMPLCDINRDPRWGVPERDVLDRVSEAKDLGSAPVGHPPKVAGATKRGRKKEETEPVPTREDEASLCGVGHIPVCECPVKNIEREEKPKKKRGRPRKSTTTPQVEQQPASSVRKLEKEEEGPHRNQQTGKREQSEVKDAPVVADDNTFGSSDPGGGQGGCYADRDDHSQRDQYLEPLREEASTHGLMSEKGTDESRKPAGQKDCSGQVPTATVGKVQYRVGLSRKSRIAPLLKSLRK